MHVLGRPVSYHHISRAASCPDDAMLENPSMALHHIDSVFAARYEVLSIF